MTQGQAASSDALFQVRIPGSTSISDELGVWQPAGEDDFAMNGGLAGDDQPTHWLVDLPADPEQARQALARQAASLGRADKALPKAATRLAVFRRAATTDPAGLQRLVEQQAGREVGELFNLPRGATAPPAGRLGPEADLAEWVLSARPGPTPALPGAQDFSAFGRNRPGPPQALPDEPRVTREASAFFSRLQRLAGQLAWIETSAAGQRQALTMVNWAGDFQSLLGSSGRDGGRRLAADIVDRHRLAVELALGTWDAWLRMAMIVMGGAAQLAVLFPANPLLALPAAYRFIRRVVSQAQELKLIL